MKLKEVFFGSPELVGREDILSLIREAPFFSQGAEEISEKDALLIFSTRRQKTWLVVSNQRLYCVLDDVRNDELPGLQWTMPADELVANGKVDLHLQSREMKKRRSEKTGVIEIGAKLRNWLYTKDLFQTLSVEETLRAIIARRMIG